MPMFPDSHVRAMARFSPLKSNIDDMVAATERLQGELEYVVDDSEVYGILTEDTFLENCPVRECTLLFQSRFLLIP